MLYRPFLIRRTGILGTAICSDRHFHIVRVHHGVHFRRYDFADPKLNEQYIKIESLEEILEKGVKGISSLLLVQKGNFKTDDNNKDYASKILIFGTSNYPYQAEIDYYTDEIELHPVPF